MKTNPRSTTRSLVLAALFLALAFVLPMITGHVPQVGNMLCPMHFPILLCGFVLGGPWGLAVGFIAAFVSGCLACKWMINVVRRGKLIYFAYYCVAVGAVTLAYHFICE